MLNVGDFVDICDRKPIAVETLVELSFYEVDIK